MNKSKTLKGEVVKENEYTKVVALLKKDPDMGVMEACNKAGVKYHMFNYYKNKAEKGQGRKNKKADRTIVISKNSRSMAPKMQTFEVPEGTRPTGRVIALVGTSADVTQALRDLLRQ